MVLLRRYATWVCTTLLAIDPFKYKTHALLYYTLRHGLIQDINYSYFGMIISAKFHLPVIATSGNSVISMSIINKWIRTCMTPYYWVKHGHATPTVSPGMCSKVIIMHIHSEKSQISRKDKSVHACAKFIQILNNPISSILSYDVRVTEIICETSKYCAGIQIRLLLLSMAKLTIIIAEKIAVGIYLRTGLFTST